MTASILSPQKIRQDVLEGPGQQFQMPDAHEPIIAKVLQ
jgi:hypothetical protein